MNTLPLSRADAPVASDRSGFGDPLFLLAPARSYSTVSIAMLAGHPDLYGLPETNLFLAGTIGEIMALPVGRFTGQDRHQHRLTGLERALAQLHDGSQDRAALDRALGWLQQRPAMPATEAMDYLLRLIRPRIGVEKSPATGESWPALRSCLSAYPGARYLHLTRHPVSTQRSMLRLFGQYKFPPGMPQAERVQRCVVSWYACHLRIVQALRTVPQHRWMRVRGEDLTGEPRIWLPRILGWLGLSCDEAAIGRMLATQRWEFAAWDGHIGFGGADPQFLASPQLRPVQPASADVIDPDWQISEDLRVKVAALARYLGY